MTKEMLLLALLPDLDLTPLRPMLPRRMPRQALPLRPLQLQRQVPRLPRDPRQALVTSALALSHKLNSVLASITERRQVSNPLTRVSLDSMGF